jgi:broad specificity phosphatase PhoE
MTDPAPDGESLEDFVSRISDVLRFVFAQHRSDIVVLVGEDELNRQLLPQLEAKPGAAPAALAPDADPMDDIVSGCTRIRRINKTLLVAL